MTPDARIFVAGHRGLVGSAVVRALQRRGFANLLCRTRQEVDLRDQTATRALLEQERPDAVILAAAKVGGILANKTYPADFIRDNLLIQCNVIEAAYQAGVKKFVFLGSSCIYPKHAPQPMTEDCLLTGPLEPTNEAYAIAKIAGLKMCRAYRQQYSWDAISLMPTNLYGPGDNFDLETSHVLPAILRKCHDAKETGHTEVTLWGTGTPRREFLHVDDLADAAVHVLLADTQGADTPELVNVGWGEDVSIAELATMIQRVVGFSGKFVFDTSKPDGTPRKLLDVSRLKAMGWSPTIPLEEGIRQTYEWYLQTKEHRGEA